MSRCVTRPTSRPPMLPFSVIGIPEKPYSLFASTMSPTVALGASTTGLRMKPCSYFYEETWLRSLIIFLWGDMVISPNHISMGRHGHEIMGRHYYKSIHLIVFLWGNMVMRL